MKITPKPLAAAGRSRATDKARSATSAPQAAGLPAEPDSESAVLAPAQAALQDSPDFDAAMVAELKAALAEGRLPFDPAKLASLIARYHGDKR